ncbi:MAG TPA: hypothetical protein VGO80_05860 [Solirubrobacteraceae bacterium]|jgi:hypothetical protein|nr:hypothetical protein [Solirubrobacteraceae bacterium]
MLLRQLTAVVLVFAATPASALAASGWTGPTEVPDSAGLSVPHLAMDRSGDAVLLWNVISRRLEVSIRERGGSFARPQRLATSSAELGIRGEQLAVGHDGTAVAVWAQRAVTRPRYRIMAAVRRPGGRFAAARAIGTAQSIFRSKPRAAVSLRGDIAVVWSRDDGPQLAIRRAGRRFERPRALRGHGFDAVVAFASYGRLHVASSRPVRPLVRGGPEAQIAIYASSAHLPSYRFAMPQRVSDAPGLEPVLAAGPTRSITLAWRDGPPDSSGEGLGQGRIFSATAQLQRPYGRPEQISPPGVLGREPVLAASEAGVLASWGTLEPNYAPASGGPISWIARRGHGPWMGAVALAGTGVATTVPGMALGGSDSTAAYMRQSAATTRSLLVRTPAWGIAAAGPEQVLAQYEEPVGQLPQHWSQAAVAAAGATTVIVWARGGRPLVAFSRTAAPAP